eukprot:scaffold190431_cov30-Tisochrysis_lutea.AAC.2
MALALMPSTVARMQSNGDFRIMTTAVNGARVGVVNTAAMIAQATPNQSISTRDSRRGSVGKDLGATAAAARIVAEAQTNVAACVAPAAATAAAQSRIVEATAKEARTGESQARRALEIEVGSRELPSTVLSTPPEVISQVLPCVWPIPVWLGKHSRARGRNVARMTILNEIAPQAMSCSAGSTNKSTGMSAQQIKMRRETPNRRKLPAEPIIELTHAG